MNREKSKIDIEANDLTKIYKLYTGQKNRIKEAFSKKKYHTDFYALQGVNFQIFKGETVGIVGRNGSGKSTLLKMLTGVLHPTSGEMKVNGKVSALLELGAGFNMELTGYENIFLNGTIMNIPRQEMEKRLDDIIGFADIGEYLYQKVKTYSSGMFVRLAFAVAINVDPDILIVDEALAVGDTRFQLKCMDKFMEFMDQGKTVLFVSHDINSIKRFCTRTLWINNGSLIMDGETDEVTDNYLDFLNSGLSYEAYLERKSDASTEDGREQCDGIEQKIAELQSITILNTNGDQTNEIIHGADTKIRIKYIVYDTDVHEPVVGLAIRTLNNRYICGINTLLDNVKLPWKIGENEIEVTYECFNLTGGNYYFDVAVFDQTATVPIDYKTKMKTFFVKMGYIAEGVVVLNHHWNVTDLENRDED